LSAASQPSERRVPTGELLGILARHLCALLFPLNALLFLATGPHTWGVALLFTLPIAAALTLDLHGPQEKRQPEPLLPAWPFDALIIVLSGVQLLNIALLARLFSTQSFLSIDALVAVFVVGANSGYSGIVIAHALLHRRSRWMQQLGRVLLLTVMYEHFYTEHLRGHHVRVGSADDPATARFGESFHRFYLRTVPAQFRSAWRLEARRLGDADMRLGDPRILRSRVLHGLVAEWGLALAILLFAGAAAFGVFLLQAIFASRALEVVNYFEHWGLTREGRRVRPIDSWDTNAWFTYYGLTGLTRHADHHAYPTRPYQQLRVWDESPKLPRGYIAMFPLVMVRNRLFQKLMTKELERRGLGPFALAEQNRATPAVGSERARG